MVREGVCAHEKTFFFPLQSAIFQASEKNRVCSFYGQICGPKILCFYSQFFWFKIGNQKVTNIYFKLKISLQHLRCDLYTPKNKHCYALFIYLACLTNLAHWRHSSLCPQYVGLLTDFGNTMKV